MESRQIKRYGPRGQGEIRVLKSGIVKVYLQEPIRDGKGEIVDYSTVVYPLAPEDVSDDIQAIKGVYIELTADETNVRSIHPWSGQFRARFTNVVRRRNGVISTKPIAKRHVGPLDDGREWDIPAHTKFYALNEIVGPKGDKHLGQTFVLGLPFLYERTVHGTVDIAWEYKAHYDELWNYMVATGIEDAEFMPGEPAAVIEQFEESIQGRGTDFTVTYLDGWLKQVTQLDVGN